jgi:hypothetical protein
MFDRINGFKKKDLSKNLNKPIVGVVQKKISRDVKLQVTDCFFQ